MRSWHDSAGMPGGFMWLYDDIKRCGNAPDYASVINNTAG